MLLVFRHLDSARIVGMYLGGCMIGSYQLFLLQGSGFDSRVSDLGLPKVTLDPYKEVQVGI